MLLLDTPPWSSLDSAKIQADLQRAFKKPKKHPRRRKHPLPLPKLMLPDSLSD